MRLKADYYQQFDADYDLDVPAEGYGGWQRAEVEIDARKTAVVVMHASKSGPREQFPGIYACCDEVPRAGHVTRTVFPPLLAAVRASELSLFHVVGGETFCRDYPGYRRAVELAGLEPTRPFIEKDPVYEKLDRFRRDNSFPGKHNLADCRASHAQAEFPAEAEPVGDEGIASSTHQLFALCLDAGVNHLIYAGFNVNWCILVSGGGIIDMSRRGLICSVFRQAVTGVENKETARREVGKELGLWRISLDYGLVFDVDDFVNTGHGQ